MVCADTPPGPAPSPGPGPLDVINIAVLEPSGDVIVIALPLDVLLPLLLLLLLLLLLFRPLVFPPAAAAAPPVAAINLYLLMDFSMCTTPDLIT